MFDLIITLTTDLVGIFTYYIPFVLIMNLACSMLFSDK